MVQVGLERYATACVRRSSLFSYKMFLNRQRTQLSQFRSNKKKQTYFNLSRVGLEVKLENNRLARMHKGLWRFETTRREWRKVQLGVHQYIKYIELKKQAER